MSNSECPFCFPKAKDTCFAESKNCMALYNVAPILPGHVLVVPKDHISEFLEISEDIIFEMVCFSRTIMKILSKVFKTKSFDWTIQEGDEAGQTVKHMHLHIIPRHKGDLPDPGDWYPRLKTNQENMIDSFNREKLKDSDMFSVIKYLKTIFTQYGY